DISPEGTADGCVVGGVEPRPSLWDLSFSRIHPGVETPGYCQNSLREWGKGRSRICRGDFGTYRLPARPPGVEMPRYCQHVPSGQTRPESASGLEAGDGHTRIPKCRRPGRRGYGEKLVA